MGFSPRESQQACFADAFPNLCICYFCECLQSRGGFTTANAIACYHPNSGLLQICKSNFANLERLSGVNCECGNNSLGNFGSLSRFNPSGGLSSNFNSLNSNFNSFSNSFRSNFDQNISILRNNVNSFGGNFNRNFNNFGNSLQLF